MSKTSLLKYAYYAFLSKPAHERELYRAIRRHAVANIVEIGMGQATRACRMIATAQRFTGREVSYTGIDLFEAQPGGLPLKQAHKRLKATGAHVRLIPGDPLSALSRSANGLQSTDMLVISSDQDSHSLENAWFYVPRMLHQTSLVFLEKVPGGSASFQKLTERQTEDLAAGIASLRRAA